MLRRKRGLIQARFSKLLGKNDKYTNLIEYGKGTLSLSTFMDIANVLEESLSYFLDGGEKHEDSEKHFNKLRGSDRKIMISLLEYFERSDKR